MRKYISISNFSLKNRPNTIERIISTIRLRLLWKTESILWKASSWRTNLGKELTNNSKIMLDEARGIYYPFPVNWKFYKYLACSWSRGHKGPDLTVPSYPSNTAGFKERGKVFLICQKVCDFFQIKIKLNKIPAEAVWPKPTWPDQTIYVYIYIHIYMYIVYIGAELPLGQGQ